MQDNSTPPRFLAAVFVPTTEARFLSLVFVPGEPDQPAVYLILANELMADAMIADLSEAGQGELSSPLFTLMRKLGEQKRRAQAVACKKQTNATYAVVMNEEMLAELLDDLQTADEDDLADSLALLLERLKEHKARREQFHNSRSPATPPRRRFRRRKDQD